MNRSDLIEIISSRRPSLTISEVDAAVKCMLSGIEDALLSGKRVEIRGFGVFSLKHQSQRLSRNPKTGEQLVSCEKYKIHFKPGKELRERVRDAALHEV